MRTRYVNLFVVVAVTMSACDSPTAAKRSSGSIEPSTVRIAVHIAGDPSIASGGGKAELPPGFSPLSFSFNAELVAGGVSGQFRQFYESDDGTVDFHGEVTCVSFDPVNNRAWIGGVVTQNESTDPAARTTRHEVGDDVWFRVVDNGEGNAPPDRTTVFGFEPGPGGIITSAEYCARQLWTAGDVNTWVVTSGNIQVNP